MGSAAYGGKWMSVVFTASEITPLSFTEYPVMSLNPMPPAPIGPTSLASDAAMPSEQSPVTEDHERQAASSMRKTSRRAVMGRVAALPVLIALGLAACTGSGAPPVEFLNRPILYELESKGSVVLGGESIEKAWPVSAKTFVDFLQTGLNYKASWEQIDQNRWILRTSFVDRMTRETNKIDMMLQLVNHRMPCDDNGRSKTCEGVVVLVSDFMFNGARSPQFEAWEFVGAIRTEALKSR